MQTDSKGFNFTTGLNKYPSRFLFEIKEEFYVRKGKLSPEILQAAQTSAAASKNSEDSAFIEGDLVIHPVWNKGKIQTVDREKNQYMVYFFEMEKEKPINFAFRFLTAAMDAAEEEKENTSPAALLELHENLKNTPDPFADETEHNSLPHKEEDQNIFNDKNANPEQK